MSKKYGVWVTGKHNVKGWLIDDDGYCTYDTLREANKDANEFSNAFRGRVTKYEGRKFKKPS